MFLIKRNVQAQRLAEHRAGVVFGDVISEMPERGGECLTDARIVQRRQRQRAIALPELRAVGIRHQRDVRVHRRRIAECTLQRDLTRRRSEEIDTAHDLRDALLRIVDDHRQLIREQAIRAAHDEVSGMRRNVFLDATAQQIVEGDHFIRHAKTERTRGLSRRQSVAARSRIHGLGTQRCGSRTLQIGTRARAVVDAARVAQALRGA